MGEDQLIKEAKKGNKKALAMLLQQHYSFLKHYLIKVTLQPALAEDLTQETMIKCIEKIHQYNGKAKFSTWLIQIGTNLFIDSVRKKKTENKWLKEQQYGELMKKSYTVQDTNWLETIEQLYQLSEEFRVPIILKHYYGYSYEEISRLLSIPEGTVKSRVHSALQQLRKELSKDETP
ncbi:RNA polymerase sigma factor SigY [Alkalihalobacterium chitinilyticum]|uniref:RNA polymerase sigma factor SigY n=1 Tax=Alkalihalobacterium chitinilyticum TaxID=2980103 RepID=A0ABT5VAW3_9BACI|nr:RNA polymerase sigma factor SigY [Alkalihalobacterium chitinilyticum]MDE5412608.1 RNA polymerase sigma factor SigY [Alkalihalobacterium chitinilyticum]